MKKLLVVAKFAAVILLALLFNYFFNSSKGIDITNQKKVDKQLYENIKKFVGEDTPIFRITLEPLEGFSTSMWNAKVLCYDLERREVRHRIIDLDGRGKEQSGSAPIFPDEMKLIPEQGVKLSQTDFSKIASNIAKARAMLEAENIEFSGIGEYSIISDPIISGQYHAFSVRSKGDTSYGVGSGARVTQTTSYYNYEFLADEEGNVYINSDEE